jgi:hypothetical protein
MSAFTVEQEAWIASRPASIQAMIRKYPPGTRLLIDGQVYHVISYFEPKGDQPAGLGISLVDPAKDYEAAMRSKCYLCEEHLK